MRNIPLRRRLLLLALVGILPLAAMSGIGLYALVQQQRAQAQQAGLDITRALATAVDSALSESVSVLEALATSILLDAGQPGGFDARAKRIMGSQSNWILIHLADTQGKVLVNTSYPDARAAPPITERESFDRVVRTRHPVIGYLSRGPEGDWGVPIRVPVVRDGKLRFILTGVIRPDAILEVVNRQQVPDDWVVSIFDGRDSRVARSRAHEKFIGSPPAESLHALMSAGAREGMGYTKVLEGDPVFTAYTRARNTGWAVAIGIPLGTIQSGVYRSLAVYGGGILLSLVFAVGAALLIARGINRPIDELAHATRALGSDEPIAVPETDIREITHLATVLATSADNAREARRQAESASRAKDEFLAMLGHELRNPLAPIVTALRLMQLRSAGMPDREREIIERQVMHLSRLVDDLLDISRITRGKVQLHRERIDLRAVVHSAMEMTQPALEHRSRPVDLELPPHAVLVLGDPTRLTQVLCNLLANAARHTPPDAAIALRLRSTEFSAELEVEDAGDGIAAELLPRIFDIFAQGQQRIDRRAGGLGLGLAIVKALVELHGGTVAAASEGPGRGSRFSIRLPIDKGSALAALPASAPLRVADGKSRILVVDDNADAADMMALLLQQAGYDVRTAPDAESALSAMENWRPDLAVLDIGLPGMDGYELARRMRARPDLADTRLVALTGYGRDTDRARALDAGFDLHMAKPAEPNRLLESVADLVHNRSKQ
jgi:signal transduction histidine kinase/ActR/RegA family two-component response regulator